MTIEQMVIDKKITDAKLQSELLHINRIVYVICSIIIAALVGRTLMGWPSIARMLFESGAYQWLCTAQELAKYSANNSDKNELCKCMAQDVAIQSLFATGMTSMMAASGFAGILIYYGGAKFSFLIGMGLLMSGWLVLGYSGDQMRGHEAGIVMIALGMDPVIFSLLSTGNLFPGNEMLVTASLASATSASMIIPTFLDYMIYYTGLGFETILTIYVMTTHIFMLVFGILFVPMRRFYKQVEITEVLKQRDSIEEMESHFNVEKGLKSPSLSENGSHDDKFIKSEEQFLESDKTELKTSMPNAAINDSCKWSKIPIFITFLIMMHFILTIAEATFIMISMQKLLGHEAMKVLSFALPLSFIPCLILGKIADKFDVIYVLWYQAAGIILTVITSILPLPYVSIAAAILFALSNACLSGQFWFLIVDIYEPKFQMPVLGILSFFSGIGALISRALYSHLADSVDSIKIGMYVFLGLAISQLIMVYLISLRKTQLKSFE